MDTQSLLILTAFAWMDEHWFLTFVMMIVFVAVAVPLLNVPLIILSRMLRAVMVICRGYPTSPLMDADGDIVHPKAIPGTKAVTETHTLGDATVTVSTTTIPEETKK